MIENFYSYDISELLSQAQRLKKESGGSELMAQVVDLLEQELVRAEEWERESAEIAESDEASYRWAKGF